VTLPPGPRTPSLWQFLRYILRPYAFLDGVRRRHGAPVTIRFPAHGSIVLLADPASVKDVFTGDPRVLHSGEANAFLGETLGPNSLLVLDDEPHARQRAPLMPPFHGERMRAHTAAIRGATLRRMEGWGAGGGVELEEECRAITLDVILETVFGERDPAFRETLRRYVRIVDRPLSLLGSRVPRWLRPYSPWRPAVLGLRAVDEALHALIARRRGAAPGDDVLSLLFRMTHEDGAPLDDGELRDHLMTLLLAGHDTTAIALGWAFEHILSHAPVLARIREEAAAGLDATPYLDAAIRESLRLRPVVPLVIRLLKAPFVAGGREYPAGVHLAPCMLLLHRDPGIYPEPEAFRPERFLGKAPDPYAWFPFGGGRRRCLGMAFALHEMRVVLATVLSRVRLELPPGRGTGVRRKGILLAPHDGTRAMVLGTG
jgi:cytochrome P450